MWLIWWVSAKIVEDIAATLQKQLHNTWKADRHCVNSSKTKMNEFHENGLIHENLVIISRVLWANSFSHTQHLLAGKAWRYYNFQWSDNMNCGKSSTIATDLEDEENNFVDHKWSSFWMREFSSYCYTIAIW